MKNAILSLIVLLAGTTAWAQPSSFICTNAPATGWETYWCVYATISSDSTQLAEVQFGTCEGSSDAGEEEPVDMYELGSLDHNPKLAATSAKWRNAGAFDVTTDSHGPATLIYGNGMAEARLQFAEKEVRLHCGF